VENLDTHRLNDVEASLSARIQEIAGLAERSNQLEDAGRNMPLATSALGQTTVRAKFHAREKQ